MGGMSNITVYFQARPEADLNQAAKEVEQKAATLPEVTSASAKPMVTHGLGPQEIMMGIQVATAMMGTATAGVVALTGLLRSLQKFADEVPALDKVMVQIGLKKLAVNDLTEQDVEKLAGK